MNQPNMLNAALDLARLCLQFGRVERITRHEDGVRLETDTDHTVMLGIFACAFAASFAPGLNTGLIAQFAMIHDLVEVYAGDTVTMQALSPGEQAAKRAREQIAYQRIEEQFGIALPWITKMIRKYEMQLSPEARFVKAMDKVLPKLTHVLNNCAVVRGMDYDFYHTEQRKLMQTLVGDMPWLMELWEQSVTAVMEIVSTSEVGARERAK